MKVDIKPSTRKTKKYVAIFRNEQDKKVKTVHFGGKGYSDYTKHKDDNRKNLYLRRHRKRENWDNYMSAGSLSRYILWNMKSLDGSIKDYKKRFKLK